MPAERVKDPLKVMSLRIPTSVANRWEVDCPNWREVVRAFMVENAPKGFSHELSELEASRAAQAEPVSEPDVEF